jgi:hypothetical protein
MTKTSQPTPFPLRMPDELRPRLESRARGNGRSSNAEIVEILTAALDAKSPLASLPTEELVKELMSRYDAHVQIVVSKEAAEAGIAPGDTNKPVRRAAKK